MPGGPLEVGYGVSYLSIAIPVFSCRLSPPMTTAHFLTAPNWPQPLGMPPRIAQARLFSVFF